MFEYGSDMDTLGKMKSWRNVGMLYRINIENDGVGQKKRPELMNPFVIWTFNLNGLTIPEVVP